MHGRALRLQQCPLGQSQNYKNQRKATKIYLIYPTIIVPEIVKCLFIIYSIIINKLIHSINSDSQYSINNVYILSWCSLTNIFKSVYIQNLKPSIETAHLAIFRLVRVLASTRLSTLKPFPQRRHSDGRSPDMHTSPLCTLRLDLKCTFNKD